MRWFVKATLIWAAIGSVIAVAVVSLGLYNVSARQDHLPGVSWVLHTTYRNAVRLRAPDPSKVPDLSDSGLIALGREHYERACAFCHARPNTTRSQTALSMLPVPPRIDDVVKDWEPNHLFWIVKNGVKMSGMPAWPSDKRDDDVWAVVAFLQSVKENTDAGANPISQASVGTSAPSDFEQKCASCHAADGLAFANKHIPRLDILSRQYVEASLKAYRNGARQSGIMQEAASQLTDQQIDDFADFISTMDAQQTTGETGANVDRGKELAIRGEIKSGVPACSSCHGPKASKKSPFYPQLAGQSRTYIEQQLKLFKEEKRGGTQRQNLMHQSVDGLNPDDISALAAYYSSLDPASVK